MAAPAKSRPKGAGHRGLSLQSDWDYIRRLLIALAIVWLAYFLWLTSRVLLLIFASILLAVLLHALAELIARRTPIPRRFALAPAILLVAAFLTGFFVLFGSQVGAQITQVFQKLPPALDAAGNRIGIPNAAAQIESFLTSGGDPSFLSRAAGIGYTVFGALADLLLVVVASIFLAADPTLYRRGIVKLLPPNQHERIREAMDVTGSALRLWFAGQFVSMVLVGAVSGLAYWWVGLPSPLALGVIAGVSNFIPFLGPILGAIPAVVFALAIDLTAVLWTVAVVVLIQQIEGNVIMPIIQRRAVLMPPALALFAIVVFGLLFGLLGIFLAVPLAVALFVLVNKLWVRETLGEETVVPGEDNSEAAPT